MKPKLFSTIIPTISVILFAISMAYFCSGVFKEKKGAYSPEKRFDMIFNAVRQSVETKESKADFMQRFENSFGSLSDFASLSLSLNDALVYNYTAKDAPTKTATFNESENVDDVHIVLSAQISKTQRGIIHAHARLSFILILAGTILSIISLFLMQNEKENTPKARPTPPPVPQKSEENNEIEDSFDSTEETVEEDEVFIDEYADDETDIVDKSEIEEEEIFEEEAEAEDSEIEEENEIDQFEERNQLAQEEAEQKEAKDSKEDISAELVADGILLKKDLDEKLRKNEYKEVSLTLIRMPTFDWNSKIVVSVLEKVREYFGKECEIYKYDEKTMSVVLNGVDLETTISDSEAILPSLEELLGEDCVFLGISAMSYRAIPADRLIVESEGALARAESDPKRSPIVAFKANPDRYKREIGNEVEKKSEDSETSATETEETTESGE